jgi:hypothetical protein
MKNLKVNSSIKEMMLEKGKTCVSIVIPTHRKSPDRQQDEIHVKKLMMRIQREILKRYPDATPGAIIDKIEELLSKVDFVHAYDGIGIYISPDFSKLVHFPFPVKEKFIISDCFEIRDLLYLEKFLSEYLVLSVDEKGGHLFKGAGEQLTEVHDGYFPKRFFDDYEYARTSLGDSNGYSLKSFERDRSIIEEVRRATFYKTLGHHLEKYLSKETVIVLAGPVKDAALFANNFAHAERIVAKIHGNFNRDPHHLAELSWKKIVEYRKREQEEMVDHLKENIGDLVTGLREAWEVANQGQALKLVVERDFSKPGFLENGDDRLFLMPPKKEHTVLTDAVDRLMETVLLKNGSVELVENGTMEEYDGFALLKRY